jgi:hypothetical protein
MLAKNIHPDFQRERLSPHFVYESYDVESGLFYNRASVGFVLVANPLELNQKYLQWNPLPTPRICYAMY